MMKFLVSFVLLFNVCAGQGVILRRPEKENYRHGFLPDDYQLVIRPKNHYQDSIIRPCSTYYQDLDCIRRVFTSTFNCMATHGPVPDPYVIDTLDMGIANSNMTFTITGAKIKGLSTGKVQEFHINKETDKYVLEVMFDSVTIAAPRSVISHHSRGMEPIITADYTNIDIKFLSLTLVISKTSNGMWKTNVYTVLTDTNMPYVMGPEITENKDPLVVRNIKKFEDDLILSVQEGFVVLGPQFMSVYLQNNICDFRYN